MVKYLLAATLSLLPSLARAEFDTGNDVWNVCTDNAAGHTYLCVGMTTAYFDMMLATGYQCASPAADRVQVRDVVLKYLSDNPGIRDKPASQLAMTSLTTAFQCARPAPPQTSTVQAVGSGKPRPKGAGPVVLTPSP
jgi:hypothetical protein